MPTKHQVYQPKPKYVNQNIKFANQNNKYGNQNTKYTNQNIKYTNRKFTLFCRKEIFVAINALFGVLFTGLENMVVYQKWQISGMFKCEEC